MNDIIRFFSFFTPKQVREVTFIFVMMVIGAILESVGIGAILPLISFMGQPDILSEYPHVLSLFMHLGLNSYENILVAGVLALVILYILKNVYITWEIYIQRSFAKKIQTLYAKELLATYLSKPYIYHVNNNSAVILRNVTSGPGILFSSMLMPIFYILSEIITVIAIWIMLLTVDTITAIAIACIVVIVVFSVIYLFKKTIARQGKIQNDSIAEYLKWVNQSIGAIKETKILRRESYFLCEFVRSYAKYAKTSQICGFLSDIPRVLTEVIVVFGLLLLILFKIVFGENPSEIVPVLGLLAMAAFRLMPSANRIISYYNSLKAQMPFFNEVYEILLEIKERLLTGKNALLGCADQKMCFKDVVKVDKVSFSYVEKDELILDEISFNIYKGDFVGVIGPSGSGKTTFVDILLGLLTPSSGRILCDSQNINSNIRGWQANLAYVPQDIYLIDGSIKENIAIGVSIGDINNELIDNVLEMAELTDFVSTLPNGVETFVGERGVKLSGGQRQRIGIARALYQKPEILVLDEATSALDNETEKSITDTILKFKGKITIIAIAHRVSTLEQCDYKIKLEAGKAEIVH